MQPSNEAMRPSLKLLRPAPVRCGEWAVRTVSSKKGCKPTRKIATHRRRRQSPEASVRPGPCPGPDDNYAIRRLGFPARGTRELIVVRRRRGRHGPGGISRRHAAPRATREHAGSAGDAGDAAAASAGKLGAFVRMVACREIRSMPTCTSRVELQSL